MDYLLGIIAVLFGALYWQTKKRSIAEAKNDNIEMKQKLNDINKDINNNSGSLEFEKLKQDEIKKEILNAEKNNISIDDILNIINKLKR